MKKRLDDRGFSVIELLIVFSVLAVAMIPLAAIQFGSRQEVGEAERMSQATQIAVSQIELARAQGFGAAVADTLTQDPFTAVTQVIADPANPFLQEVQVTVAWTDAGGARQVVMAGKRALR